MDTSEAVLAETPAAPRSPLRNPAIRRVVAADVISRLGSRLTLLAIPWFVLVTTGSATRMGLVFGAELLPAALLGIPSGLLIVKLGVRRTVILGEASQTVLIGAIPLLHSAGALSFGVLLVLVALSGVTGAPFIAAQRLLLPEILGPDESALTAANGLFEASTWGTQFAGPALAGILIAAMGPTNVLWIDAATYLVSAVLLTGLPKPQADLSAAADARGVFAGARYVLHDRVLGRIILVGSGYGLLVPALLIALPVLADRSFQGDARTAGWLLAVWGLGALTGTIALMPLLRRIAPLKLGALAAVAMAVPLWALPFSHVAVVIGTLLLISGFFIPLLNAPGITLLTTRPPLELQAQVVTFFVTANLLMGPLAYVVAGAVVTHQGTGVLFAAAAVAATVCAAIMASLVRIPIGAAPGSGPVPGPVSPAADA